jgi:cell division protein FtsB
MVWMLFFDDRDVITTYFKHRKELSALKSGYAYYSQQIAQTHAELEKLKSNAATIEEYAREKYRMKRENEDVFIVETPKKAE